mmetsp:Transcript_45476/g.126133  ORF Transcript_45476/g.126133 Transcript_45476/m.126133 type:complete len:322 (+) Transcript_45476:1467-2432(+)
MHHVAEFGAAAHWAYKAGGGARASLPWLQLTVRKWDHLDCAHEFMQLVRQELLGTRVFVFTANGQILNLARGATVADVVEQVGEALETHVPQINSVSAPASALLQNGDIVSFVPRIGQLVDRSTARPALLPINSGGVDGALGYDDAAPACVWEVCNNCMPLPGDHLIGSMDDPTGARGVVHRDRINCLALRRQLAAGANVVLAKQAGAAMAHAVADHAGRRPMLSTKIVVFTRDAPGVLLAVSSVVTENSENIVDVHSETQAVGLASAFQYSISVHSTEQLTQLMRCVGQLPDVVRVERGSMQDMMHDNPNGFWDMAREPE